MLLHYSPKVHISRIFSFKFGGMHNSVCSLVAFIILVPCLVMVNGANEGKNAKEFSIFCGFYEIAQSSIPAPDDKVQTEAQKLVENINRLHEIAKSSEPLNVSFLREVEKWNPTLVVPSGASNKRLVAKKLRRIKEKAEEKQHRLQSVIEEERTKSVAAQAQLRKALYGEKADENTTQEVEADMFGSSTNRAQLCGKEGGAQNVGTSIPADIACLCAEGSGGSATKACDGITDLAAWAADTPTAARTAWTNIKTNCPRTGLVATDEVIGGLLSQLTGSCNTNLGSSANDLADGKCVIGYSNQAQGTGCNGGNGQLGCVMYNVKGKSGGAKGKLEYVPWVGHMYTAKDDLQEARRNRDEAKLILSQLENLEHLAWSLYDEMTESPPKSDGNETAIYPSNELAKSSDRKAQKALSSETPGVSAAADKFAAIPSNSLCLLAALIS